MLCTCTDTNKWICYMHMWKMCTCIRVISIYIACAFYTRVWHVQLFEVCIVVGTGTAYICSYHVWFMCNCVEHVAHKQLSSIPAPEEACLSASSPVLSPLHLHPHTSCFFTCAFQGIDWAHRLLYPNRRGYQRGGALPLCLLDQCNH